MSPCQLISRRGRVSRSHFGAVIETRLCGEGNRAVVRLQGSDGVLIEGTAGLGSRTVED
jgi:hypothetical protein